MIGFGLIKAASHPEFLKLYHEKLKGMAGPHVAFCDVLNPWTYITNRMGYLSLSGNGINHPNDFGHRLYAEVLIATVFGEQKQD